ncbi:VOC family protein [Cellulomonas rhizosphaerae]|uniref:VOC family protein n=1 Tax=Cellulomonas rhizosphaerae TaxID=2293719 RepID=A0A413RHL7_9CELL|nr:VOC family protein [Cellulomonas rhizosphaerae]RHA37633.1 VOC family protein [Cellulomonas rhizosphaerae]
MTTHSERWPAGTPAWADITVPSLDQACAFYGPLLGWEFEVGGPETGGYTVATVGGRRVVGLGESATDQPSDPQWCLYLATDDANATTTRVAAAGGRVVVSATPLPGMGTMAIAADPTGAVFGLWQSGRHTGWDVTGEPGTVAWTEVMSTDQPQALAFYQHVLELDVMDAGGDGFVYAVLRRGDLSVAGVGQTEANSAWTLYLEVADVDATIEAATGLGATVAAGAADSPYGRVARLRGPFGETFAIITPAWHP